MPRTANGTEAPDLREYLAPVWRFKWIILGLALTVAVATYLYYDHKPKTYESSTDVYLGTSSVEAFVTGAVDTGSERDLANQARVVRSRPVAARVAQRIGFEGDPAALLGAVQVIPDPEADVLTIAAVSPDARSAARLANAFAAAFLDQRIAMSRDDADRALEAARHAMADLEGSPGRESEQRRELAARISQLEILRALPRGEAEQLDRAEPAAAPSAPRPTRNAIFAFVLTLALGSLAAYGINRIDRRIREIDEVTPLYDAPVLGRIPRAAERMSPTLPPAIPSSLREPFRTLRTSLEIAGAERGTFVITSGGTGEGKSLIVRNLAMAYREAGKEVAIVEADLRRPSAGDWLCTPSEPGLADVLMGDATLDEAIHQVPGEVTGPLMQKTAMRHNGSGPTEKSNGARSFEVSALGPASLFLLPGGSPAPDPPTLLGTGEFRLLLRELADRFDIVLIDTPALLPVSDALPLLGEADGALIVSRVGTTTEKSAEQLTELVGRVRGVQLLGVVANDVAVRSRARYGYAEYASAG